MNHSEVTLKEMQYGDLHRLSQQLTEYENSKQYTLAKIVKERILCEKESIKACISSFENAKKLCSERGDFENFSLISQDIREMERLLNL